MDDTLNVPEKPRILITRLSAVGDCIHTMPLIGALRDRYPDAWIGWAVQAGPATLLEGYPGLDEIVVVNRDWLKSLSEVRALGRRLRALRIDVALDPQSLTKSSLLGWLSGAPIRIGFDRPQGRELSLLLNNVRVAPTQEHVVRRYLELVQRLTGIVEPAVRFQLPRRDPGMLQDFVRRTHLGQGYAVLNPGAGWDSKLWLPRRFAQVAKHLGACHRLPSVVVWAGDRERQWAEQIVARSGGHAWLAPPTSLPELAELMRGARLCVAADTGPLHLAAAVGTPCVGLYGTTRPERCGPYGRQHRTVQACFQPGNSRQRRTAGNDAMQAIEATDVIRACDQLLSSAEAA